jgi:hypothetical protein
MLPTTPLSPAGAAESAGRLPFVLARMMMCGHRQLVRNTDAAEEVVAVIRVGGGTAHAVQGDMSRTTAGWPASEGRPTGHWQRPANPSIVDEYGDRIPRCLTSPATCDLNFGCLIFLSSTAAMTGGVISTAHAKAAVVGMMGQRLGRTAALGAVGTVQHLARPRETPRKSISALSFVSGSPTSESLR